MAGTHVHQHYLEEALLYDPYDPNSAPGLSLKPPLGDCNNTYTYSTAGASNAASLKSEHIPMVSLDAGRPGRRNTKRPSLSVPLVV